MPPTHPPADIVEHFFSEYPLQHYEKRQLLLQSGEESTKIFYIIDGWVSQYDITPTGNEIVLNVFKPGAFFPMSKALTTMPNRYFLEAATPLTVRIAPHVAVIELLRREPEVGIDLLARVYRGIDGIFQRLAYAMSGTARERVIFEILNAAYRFGTSDDAEGIAIPIHEGELAQRAGLARETVSRALQDLKHLNLLSVGHHSVTVHDLTALERLLDDPTA
jgi:CRP/FNR family transcriptional regulator, dissimilatory nitrate respiration regulator